MHATGRFDILDPDFFNLACTGRGLSGLGLVGGKTPDKLLQFGDPFPGLGIRGLLLRPGLG